MRSRVVDETGERAGARPATTRRPARLVLLYLVGTAVLGVVADAGLELGNSTEFLFVSAAPWVLLAFSSGRASPPRWSAVAGSLTLITGLLSYYCWMVYRHGVSVDVLGGSGFNGGTWILLGLLVGAVSGGFGGATRSRHPWVATLPWSGAAAVPCVDGLLQVRYGDSPAVLVVTVVALTVVALLGWAWRGGAKPLLHVGGLAVATVVLWRVELTVLQEVLGRLTWI